MDTVISLNNISWKHHIAFLKLALLGVDVPQYRALGRQPFSQKNLLRVIDFSGMVKFDLIPQEDPQTT